MSSARRRGSVSDTGLSIIAIALTSVPEFVLALIVLLAGATELNLFPVTSGGIATGHIKALVLPTITLGLGAGAYVYRLARVSIAEALSAPYVRTAVLNGFSPARILWRHVLPNASAVIVNVVALNAIYLVSGVIVIENVFAYPGIGTLLVQAIEFEGSACRGGSCGRDGNSSGDDQPGRGRDRSSGLAPVATGSHDEQALMRSATVNEVGRERIGKRTRAARFSGSGLAGTLGFVLLVLGVGIAVVGPYLSPYSPYALLGAPLQGPGPTHWLGTDQLGRDVLSRVLSGGQTVLVTSTFAVVVAFLIGAPIGLMAGYRAGTFDMICSRLADIIMSIPPLVLVLIFVIALGSSNLSVVVLTGCVTAPRVFRIVRGATQAFAEHDFILAARARGERTLAILLRELLPNITGPLLAEVAIRLNFSIIFIATLNFLGLGVQPPSSDWGLMVSEGRIYLAQAPLISLAPAAAIAVVTIGINLVSDHIGTYLARNSRSHSTL